MTGGFKLINNIYFMSADIEPTLSYYGGVL